MGKSVVIYKSVYGATEKYAKWIAEKLNADLFEASKVNSNMLVNYDTIIYGGGIYASNINGISVITKNYKNISNKKIIVFTVGLLSTDNKEVFKPMIEKTFNEEMRKNISFYHFKGNMNYSKLKFVHKVMMKMLKKMILRKKPEEMSSDDKAILEVFNKEIDFINENSIEPLINFTKKVI